MTKDTTLPLPPLPEWLMRIIRSFTDRNFQCYMVGGAVRDQLRGQTVYDYDLATNATPNEMKKIWRRIVSTGAKYGTMTLLSGRNQTEVTTFRSEDNYQDSRHPEQISFGKDIIVDLSRRDFTINAMAYDPLTNRLIDPFGGSADIKRRIIRTVGVPQQRLTEDALRILRAVRFATTLDFTIHAETEQALIACAQRVRAVSAERIREELERIIASPRCAAGFAHLSRLQLLPIVFRAEGVAAGIVNRQETDKLDPLVTRYLEIAATIAIEDEHNGITTTEASQAITKKQMAEPATASQRQSRLRHALLWHALQRYGEEAATNHEHKDEREIEQTLVIIATQLDTLRYSRAHRESVVHLVRMLKQLPTSEYSDSEVRYFFFSVGNRYINDIQQLIKALENGGEFTQTSNATARLLSMAQKQQVFSYRDLAINGDDLQQLGYQRGRKIGDFMAHAIRYVCAHPEENTRHHLKEQAHTFLTSKDTEEHGTHDRNTIQERRSTEH